MVAALPGDGLGQTGQDGPHRKSVLDPHGDFIKERISQTPHLTLHALKDELATRGAMPRTMRYGCSCAARDCGSKKRCSLLSGAALM